jgi:CheY-like chemotaxis protein
MNGRLSSLPVANAIIKKRILLVDRASPRRDLRAKVIRKLGAEVDCASDTTSARALWRPDSYDLVLVGLRDQATSVAEFCAELGRTSRPQRIAFLVGKPDYLADIPSTDATFLTETEPTDEWGAMVKSIFAAACGASPSRGGLFEASWRICASRTAANPRPGHNGSHTPVSRIPADPTPAQNAALSFGEAVRRLKEGVLP